MKKIRDPHLRCEICDFCESVDSLTHSGLSRSRDLPDSATVSIRDGRAICNACEVSHFNTIKDNEFLTTSEIRGNILYSPGAVHTYPATHPKLTYYDDFGIYQTDEEKEQWRTEYQAALMDGCVPFRENEDEN